MKFKALTLPIFATLLSFGLISSESQAALIFTGSGTGTGGTAISGTAEFEFVTYDFGSGSVDAVEITLTNTAASTDVRGNLITGLFFTLDGSGSLSTTSSGFDGLATYVTTLIPNGPGPGDDALGSATNVDIAPAVNSTSTDGGYQLSNGPFGTANSGGDYSAFEYGISTVGMGLTGFGGTDVNGDDYGIYAAGTSSATLLTGGLKAALPLTKEFATFWILKPDWWTSLDQLGSSVRITYGSLPDNYITAYTDGGTVPEPASLALMGIGLAGLGFSRRKKS